MTVEKIDIEDLEPGDCVWVDTEKQYLEVKSCTPMMSKKWAVTFLIMTFKGEVEKTLFYNNRKKFELM